MLPPDRIGEGSFLAGAESASLALASKTVRQTAHLSLRGLSDINEAGTSCVESQFGQRMSIIGWGFFRSGPVGGVHDRRATLLFVTNLS